MVGVKNLCVHQKCSTTTALKSKSTVGTPHENHMEIMKEM